ncbi:MAG: hypothetical protein FJ279_26750, partial [Planctomycetes bacterium]|nr:hypothetical protein [Planctomycetota bacterium]
MRAGWRADGLIAACVLASAGAALIVQLRTAGELCYPIDDGWVYAVYARNLAEGHGYSFNEGDHFICGTTSVLWPLMLTPCYSLFGDCMAPAEALGAIFLLLTCLYVHKIARKILVEVGPQDFLPSAYRVQESRATSLATTDSATHRALALILSVFVAFSGFMAWSVLSGLETLLFTFLTAAAVYYRLQYADVNDPRCLISSAIASGAGLVRPEGFLLAGLLMADTALSGWSGSRGPFRQRLALALFGQFALLCLVLFPYVLVNYRTCGMLFPTSFQLEPPLSKGLFFAAQSGEWADYVRLVALGFPRWASKIGGMFLRENVLMLALASAGVVALVRQAARSSAHGRSFILPALLAVYPLARAMFLNSDQLGQEGRHIHNLIPIFYLVGGVTLSGFVRGWPGVWSSCGVWAAAVFFALGLAGAVGPIAMPRVPVSEARLARAEQMALLCAAGLAITWLAARRRWASGLEEAVVRSVSGGSTPGAPADSSEQTVRRRLGAAVLMLTAITGALRFVGLGSAPPHGLLRYRQYVKNTAEMHLPLARWVAQHTPRDAAVAMFDKEAMKWYSRRRVIHLGGRTNPEIAAYRQRYGDWDRASLFYVASRRPQYLIIGPNVHRWLSEQRWMIEEVHRVFLDDNTHIWENPQIVYRLNWQAFDR